MLDAIAVGREGEIAALGGRPVGIGRGEMQGAEAAGARKDMHAAVATVIAERRADRIVDRRIGVVFDVEGEQRGGHRGIAVVVGNERAERGHPHLAGKGVAVEFEFGDGKAPGEGHVVEMRHAGHRIAIGAEAEAVELARAGRARRHALVGAVEHARVEQLAVALGLDGEMAVAVVLMDGGAVAQAPVDEAPAAGQRDAAGSDAAERKGQILTARAGIDEALVDRLLLQLLQHCSIRPVLFSS